MLTEGVIGYTIIFQHPVYLSFSFLCMLPISLSLNCVVFSASSWVWTLPALVPDFADFPRFCDSPKSPMLDVLLSRVSGDLYFGPCVLSTFYRIWLLGPARLNGSHGAFSAHSEENKRFETSPAPKEQRPNDPWQAWYSYPYSPMGKEKF